MAKGKKGGSGIWLVAFSILLGILGLVFDVAEWMESHQFPSPPITQVPSNPIFEFGDWFIWPALILVGLYFLLTSGRKKKL